jgi:hypothetical protein
MGDWDAVIDVSNVCWSPALPPVGRRRPFWDRLGLVTDAWRRLHPEARLRLAADESLMRALDDPEGLRRLKASGELVTAAVADSIILGLARDEGLHVITRDHYIDHRDSHPWIEASPGRFHGWETIDGQVRITPLGITARSAQEVSMARELKDLRRTRLDPRNPEHRRILHTRWKCGNTSCSQAAHWQGQLLAWPMVSGAGLAVCPGCGEPLEPLGPRTQLFEVVVAERASQAEIMRFPLEADIPVIVGRGTIKGIDLSASPHSGDPVPGGAPPGGSAPPGGAVPGNPGPSLEVIKRVSRLHLLLRIEEVTEVNWRLAVIDLDSTNGTEVERWAGTGFLQSRPVPADKETFLSARDRLVLGGAVQLRLSGKRYVIRPNGSTPAPPADTVPADTGDGPPGDATLIRGTTISDAPPPEDWITGTA